MVAVLEHRRAGTTSLVASCVTAAPDGLRQRTVVLADLCDAGEPAAGMSDGDYVLGPAAVTVEGGVAYITGTDTIASGTARLIDVVRRGCLMA